MQQYHLFLDIIKKCLFMVFLSVALIITLSGCSENPDGTMSDPLGIGQVSHDTAVSFANDLQTASSNTSF